MATANNILNFLREKIAEGKEEAKETTEKSTKLVEENLEEYKDSILASISEEIASIKRQGEHRENDRKQKEIRPSYGDTIKYEGN